jgi:hypothetical protein
MVRDTAARLERATEELSNFVVRRPILPYFPLPAGLTSIFAKQKSAKMNAELEQGAELLDAEAVLAAPTSA